MGLTVDAKKESSPLVLIKLRELRGMAEIQEGYRFKSLSSLSGRLWLLQTLSVCVCVCVCVSVCLALLW